MNKREGTAHALIEAIVYRKAMLANNLGLDLKQQDLDIVYNSIVNHANIKNFTKRTKVPIEMKISSALGRITGFMLSGFIFFASSAVLLKLAQMIAAWSFGWGA